MQNNLSLYPNLVSARKAVCTQYELAEQIGISQQEISRYERGEIKAPVNYIIDLAAVCGVSVDYILGLSEKGKEPDAASPEHRIVQLYKKLDPENRARLEERAEALYDMQCGI